MLSSRKLHRLKHAIKCFSLPKQQILATCLRYPTPCSFVCLISTGGTEENSSAETAKTLPDSADVVVIGGGSIGCSTAYHLAKFGAGKVVLVEKETLTAGTTWHSAGIVYNIRDGDALTQMQNQTIQLLRDDLPKEIDFDTGFITTGALYITRRCEALEGLEKKSLIASQFGIKLRRVDEAEMLRLHPLMNTEKILGAFYSPQDGIVDPATACTAYIKGATKYGAQVFEHCVVDNVKTDQTSRGLRKVVAVETNLGTIKTNHVVNCGGCWAPYIAQMIDVRLPQITYKHTYVVTEVINGIERTAQIRDSDYVLYHRRQGDALLFGGYEKDPEVVLDGKPEKNFAFGLYDMNWDQFEGMYNGSVELVPEIGKVGIRSTICGPESFTPDSRPLIGETPRVRGFYTGSGFNSGGIMMGGGAGRQIAHLVMHGDGEYDLQECDVNRFTRKQSHTCIVESCHDGFTTRFEVSAPNRQYLGGRNVRTTPMTEDHIDHGAYMNSIFGHEVPMYFMPGQNMPVLKYDYFGYYGNKKRENYLYRDHLAKDANYDVDKDIQQIVTQESLSCHTSVALCDLSHMSEFDFRGQNAEKVLRYLLTSNVTSLEPRTAVDTLLLNKHGTIVARVMVARLSDGSFRLTAASELQDVILRHVNHFLIDNDIDCEFCDVTDETARLRTLGKLSLQTLCKVSGNNCEAIAPMCFVESKVSGKTVVILRGGHEYLAYYDIVCKMDDVKAVYGALLDAGMTRVGLRPLNSVLLETGQTSYISKFWRGLNPQEANVSRLCTLDGDRDYLGRSAVEDMMSQPKASNLMTFTSDSHTPLFVSDMIWRNDKYVGVVMDAAFGSRSGKYHVIGHVSCTDEHLANATYKIGSGSRTTKAEIITF